MAEGSGLVAALPTANPLGGVVPDVIPPRKLGRELARTGCCRGREEASLVSSAVWPDERRLASIGGGGLSGGSPRATSTAEKAAPWSALSHSRQVRPSCDFLGSMTKCRQHRGHVATRSRARRLSSTATGTSSQRRLTRISVKDES